MTSNKKYGNIYEIKLPSGKYVYVCLIEAYSFGVLNCKSNTPIENIQEIVPIGFVTYKSCKESGIKQKVWKLVGYIDLAKQGIHWPDLAIYTLWDIEGSIERANITRNGSLLKVDKEYFLNLVDKGYIDGFFDNHLKFENWIDTFSHFI